MRGMVWAVVLLLVTGVAVSATSLSGRWTSQLDVVIDPAAAFADSLSLWSELATELQIGSWTFANTTFFGSEAGLDLVTFAAQGSLGAFDITSALAFREPQGFSGIGAARVVVGGLEWWGVATLERWPRPVGAAGLLMGTLGSVGSVEYYADIAFNLELTSFPYIMEHGFDAFWDLLSLCHWSLLDTAQGGCGLPFKYLNLYAEFPWDCLRVQTWAVFYWLRGFGFFDLQVSDVDLGLSGLTLDQLALRFDVDSKTVLFDFGLRMAETFCFTPYVSLQEGASGRLIDGLSFDALELICNVGDVTVIVSELLRTSTQIGLGESILYIGSDARIHELYLSLGGFGECFDPVDANEAIGIEFGREGCCGASMKFGVYAFFDTDLPGTSLFDWSETHARLEYATASSLTVSGYLDVSTAGITWLGVAFEVAWGDLVIFGPDWQAACCGIF